MPLWESGLFGCLKVHGYVRGVCVLTYGMWVTVCLCDASVVWVVCLRGCGSVRAPVGTCQVQGVILWLPVVCRPLVDLCCSDRLCVCVGGGLGPLQAPSPPGVPWGRGTWEWHTHFRVLPGGGCQRVCVRAHVCDRGLEAGDSSLQARGLA